MSATPSSTPSDYLNAVSALERMGFVVACHHRGLHYPMQYSPLTQSFLGEDPTASPCQFHLLVHPTRHLIARLDSYVHPSSSGPTQEILNSLCWYYQLNVGFRGVPAALRRHHGGLPGTCNSTLSPLAEHYLLISGQLGSRASVAPLAETLEKLDQLKLRPLPFSEWLDSHLYLDIAHFFYTPSPDDFAQLRAQLALLSRDVQPEQGDIDKLATNLILPALGGFLSRVEQSFPGLARVLLPSNFLPPATHPGLVFRIDAKEELLNSLTELHTRRFSPSVRRRLLALVSLLDPRSSPPALSSDPASIPTDSDPLSLLPALSSYPATPIIPGLGLATLLSLYRPELLVPWLRTRPRSEVVSLLTSTQGLVRSFTNQVIRDFSSSTSFQATSGSSSRLQNLDDYLTYAQEVLSPEEFSNSLVSQHSSWLGEMISTLAAHPAYLSAQNPPFPAFIDLLHRHCLPATPLLDFPVRRTIKGESSSPSRPQWVATAATLPDALHDLRSSVFDFVPPEDEAAITASLASLATDYAKRALEKALPQSIPPSPSPTLPAKLRHL